MSVSDQFRGLPMEDLIGGPLAAACTAQYNLAQTMLSFIGSIGFKDNKTRTLDFDLERPVDNGSGKLTKETVKVQAPLLGLVPIPALLIESVKINFSMEVKAHTESKSSTKTDTSVDYKSFWSPVKVSGKVSTNRENTRSTDNTAKYDVTVVATQQQPQEGMSKLMDLLASAVEPISISAQSQSQS